MEPTNEVVERPSPLVAFDVMEAKLEAFEVKNASLVFNYEDPKGEKDARQHIYKLRQVKSNIAKIHKDAKAGILEEGRRLDNRKNNLTNRVEGYISVHKDPLDAIEARKAAEAKAKADAERLEAERIEQERLDAIKAREDEAERKMAELRLREDALKQNEADRVAKAKVEKDAQLAAIKAENDKLIADRKVFEAEQEKVRQAEIDRLAHIQRKEEARLKAEADRLAEIDRKAKAEQDTKDAAAKLEADRVANEEHREHIEACVQQDISDLLGEHCDYALIILEAIKTGKIEYLTINY